MFISLAEHLKPVKALMRPHKGVVVDNEDQKKIGRVKVEIKGLLEGNKDDLPWVTTLFDPNRVDVPEVGDELYIIFPFQSIYFPFSLGYWINTDNKNSDFDTNYPKTFGLSKAGFKSLYNKETEEYLIEHPSGTKAKINKQGKLEVTVAQDLSFTIDGKATYTATGDVEYTTDGSISYKGTDISFTADGKLELSAQGQASITSQGQAEFSGQSGTTLGNSASTTMVNGSVVLIAGGGFPVAVLTSTAVGPGNLGGPVVSTIIDGSTKVQAIK